MGMEEGLTAGRRPDRRDPRRGRRRGEVVAVGKLINNDRDDGRRRHRRDRLVRHPRRPRRRGSGALRGRRRALRGAQELRGLRRLLAHPDRAVGGPAQPDAEVRASRASPSASSSGMPRRWTAMPSRSLASSSRSTIGNLVMSGAGELARQLVEAGLVDELLLLDPPTHPGARAPARTTQRRSPCACSRRSSSSQA